MSRIVSNSPPFRAGFRVENLNDLILADGDFGWSRSFEVVQGDGMISQIVVHVPTLIGHHFSATYEKNYLLNFCRAGPFYFYKNLTPVGSSDKMELPSFLAMAIVQGPA